MERIKPELKALFADEQYDHSIMTITSGDSSLQLLKFSVYFTNPYTIRFLALCEMVRNDDFKFDKCIKWIKAEKRDALSLEDYVNSWHGSLFRIEQDGTYTNQVVADYFKELDEVYNNLPQEYTTDANHPIWQHLSKIGEYFLKQTDYVNQQINLYDSTTDWKEKLSWMDELLREMKIAKDIIS